MQTETAKQATGRQHDPKSVQNRSRMRTLAHAVSLMRLAWGLHRLPQLRFLTGADVRGVACARTVVLLQLWRPFGCEQGLLGCKGVGHRILWVVEDKLEGVAFSGHLCRAASF